MRVSQIKTTLISPNWLKMVQSWYLVIFYTCKWKVYCSYAGIVTGSIALRSWEKIRGLLGRLCSQSGVCCGITANLRHFFFPERCNKWTSLIHWSEFNLRMPKLQWKPIAWKSVSFKSFYFCVDIYRMEWEPHMCTGAYEGRKRETNSQKQHSRRWATQPQCWRLNVGPLQELSHLSSPTYSVLNGCGFSFVLWFI